MKKTTDGEQLFFLVRAAVASASKGSFTNPSIRDALDDLGGSAGVVDYFHGALSILVTRRLIQFWREERESVGAEARGHEVVAAFVRQEVLHGLERSQSLLIARKVVAAVLASSRDISQFVRRRVVEESTNPTCYLCGLPLSLKDAKGSEAVFTLEHLWPLSLGGSSVEENLLPACQHCQKAKGDGPSWEWFAVQNLVVTNRANSIASIPRAARIARHYRRVMALCGTENLSLKEGFLRQGPYAKDSPRFQKSQHPLTFFDL